ncbi:hypothetical protein RBB50_001357 [Rhinocladiella similis]
MGNICSKSANQPDNFSTPGHTLGSSATPKPASAQPTQRLTASTPGRTLGGSRDGATSPDNARSAAARAAEERATKSNKPGGKLSAQLSSQKKQTQNQLLNAGSDAERRARDADEGAQARNWN